MPVINLTFPALAAAAVMAHAGNSLAQRRVTPRRVGLGQQPGLVAAVACDAQIPARHRFGRGLAFLAFGALFGVICFIFSSAALLRSKRLRRLKSVEPSWLSPKAGAAASRPGDAPAPRRLEQEVAVRKLGLAIVALGFLGGSARGELLAQFPLNGMWQGGAFSNDNTHQFNACTASAPYLSGISMFVSVNRAYGWSLAFRSEAWNLQKNQQIPLSLTFDGQSPWSGTATAVDANMVIVPMVADSTLIKLFRAAYQLRIDASGRVFVFNLDGTSRLMVGLANCVAARLAIERGEPPPRFNAPPVVVRSVNTPPTPTPPSSEYELIAMRLASNLLLETKMPNAHLLAASETPPQLRNRGVVWTSDAGIGAVMIFPAAIAGKDAQEVTTWLISNDATACKGDFVSGRASELVDNTIVARSTTECKDTAGLHVHRFFTLPGPTNSDFIVFEIDRDGKDKPAPASDSPLGDTNFQAAAVKAAYVK
jgi:hypothetical protein